MDFDCDAVTDLELVDSGTEPHDRAHIFMARGETAVERQLAIDHGRHAVLEDLDVRRADRDRIDAYQHLGPAGLGHRLFDKAQLLRAAEHPGLHRLRDPVLVATVVTHKKAPIRRTPGRINVRARHRSDPGR